jgi:hypothetical protein
VANTLSTPLATTGIPESAHRRTLEAGFFGTAAVLTPIQDAKKRLQALRVIVLI